ncbi:MAG: CopG family transcriptional regulator [Bryobacteraceae bacterium]
MSSIRTTVTLDEDVLERVKQESRSRGMSFRETLNDLLRTGLVAAEMQPPQRRLEIKPHHGGYYPGLNYDCTEVLIEHAEGVNHR